MKTDEPLVEPNSNTDAHDQGSVPETVVEAIKAEDEPMERKHPSAAGALVWFTYPVLLVAAILVGFALIAIFSSK